MILFLWRYDRAEAGGRWIGGESGQGIIHHLQNTCSQKKHYFKSVRTHYSRTPWKNMIETLMYRNWVKPFCLSLWVKLQYYLCVKGWLIDVLERMFNGVEFISFQPPVCVCVYMNVCGLTLCIQHVCVFNLAHEESLNASVIIKNVHNCKRSFCAFRLSIADTCGPCVSCLKPVYVVCNLCCWCEYSYMT